MEETAASDSGGVSSTMTPMPGASDLRLGPCVGQASNPRAPPMVTGMNSGLSQESVALAPPMEMGLGALSHPHREDRPGTSEGATKGIEEVPWEPPHPWDAPAHMTHTFLKQGDRVDVVEEEDVDLLVKTLNGHISLVNNESLVNSS